MFLISLDRVFELCTLLTVLFSYLKWSRDLREKLLLTRAWLKKNQKKSTALNIALYSRAVHKENFTMCLSPTLNLQELNSIYKYWIMMPKKHAIICYQRK